MSIVGKWVSRITQNPAAGATPSLSFTVPPKCVFKCVLSVFCEAGGTNNVGCFALVDVANSCYVAFLTPADAATTSEKYGDCRQLELPEGDYTGTWIDAPSGVGNQVSITGNNFRIR